MRALKLHNAPEKKSVFAPFLLEAAALTQAAQSFIPSSPQLGYVQTHSAAEICPQSSWTL